MEVSRNILSDHIWEHYSLSLSLCGVPKYSWTLMYLNLIHNFIFFSFLGVNSSFNCEMVN